MTLVESGLRKTGRPNHDRRGTPVPVVVLSVVLSGEVPPQGVSWTVWGRVTTPTQPKFGHSKDGDDNFPVEQGVLAQNGRTPVTVVQEEER